MTDFIGLIIFLIFISGVSSYTLLKFKTLKNEEINFFKQQKIEYQIEMIKNKTEYALREQISRDKLIRSAINQVILTQNQRIDQKQIENYSTIDVYDIDTGKKTKYLKPKSRFFD